MKNAVVWIIIIGAAVAGAFYFFGDQEAEETVDETEETENENDTETSVPAGWETYTSEEFGFSLAHPSDADVAIEAENHTKFTVLGSDNATGEITDGFTFTVSVYDQEEGQTLEEFAQARLEAELEVADEVEEVSETTLNGERAYTYTTLSLGEITHYVLEHEGGRAIVISHNISDPNNAGYQDMVDLMITTLELSS